MVKRSQTQGEGGTVPAVAAGACPDLSASPPPAPFEVRVAHGPPFDGLRAVHSALLRDPERSRGVGAVLRLPLRTVSQARTVSPSNRGSSTWKRVSARKGGSLGK